MTNNESSANQRFTAFMNRHMIAFYTIRKLGEQNRDVARGAIESARKSAREWSDVGRNWAKRPADVGGLVTGAAKAAAAGQARSLDLARKWWDGVRQLRP